VSSQAPDGLPRLTRVDYEQDVGTAFDKAELVDSVRVILHNTKSRITADNIDCYSLRTMIAAKRLNNIRTEMSKTALKISTVEKGSKLSVYPNGDQGSFDERSFERRCLELCEKPRPTMHQDSEKCRLRLCVGQMLYGGEQLFRRQTRRCCIRRNISIVNSSNHIHCLAFIKLSLILVIFS
jgi:hypothetical protein